MAGNVVCCAWQRGVTAIAMYMTEWLTKRYIMTVSEVRMRNGWQCGVLCLAVCCAWQRGMPKAHRDRESEMTYAVTKSARTAHYVAALFSLGIVFFGHCFLWALFFGHCFFQ